MRGFIYLGILVGLATAAIATSASFRSSSVPRGAESGCCGLCRDVCPPECRERCGPPCPEQCRERCRQQCGEQCGGICPPGCGGDSAAMK